MSKLKDNYDNLKTCMSILGPEIQELSNLLSGVEKKVLFMFEDYHFLSKIYGISGAQGLSPCLMHGTKNP